MPATVTLTQVADKLSAVPEAMAREAVRRAAPGIRVAAAAGVRRHFAEGRAPDGSPWPPLGRPRPAGGSKPLRDKGLLAASVSALVTETEIVLRANAPGARLHQEGGVVAAKGKLLAIPVTRDAARAGGPRQFPRPLFAAGKPGKGFLAERGRRGRLVVHYLLRASVTIPARPYLGVSAATAQIISALVGRELAALLTTAIRGT